MLETKSIKFKLCLVGEYAVGKTCLIRKYVFNEFSDGYISTLGAKVTKKRVSIQHPDTKEMVEVDLLIWDIMGQKGFRRLLQEAYFYGAQGIVAVCDNTRESTLSELESWIDGIHHKTQEIPTVFLGNKCDLIDLQQIGLNELKSFSEGYESPGAYLTSAKTGFNVDLAYNILSSKILKDSL
ncbi:MAG: GTP-binding protein [Thermoplasmata archaeon]|nr:MAG: GTP-binding protein [Thermoplasmata archaeon]